MSKPHTVPTMLPDSTLNILFFVLGNQVANIIGMPMNALLCSSNFLGGWQAIFYVNGAFTKITNLVRLFKKLRIM